MDSNGSFTNEIWLEQHFHVKESLAPTVMMFPSGSSWTRQILQFTTNRSNHLDLIVDEASAVSSFVMHSTISWTMAVPPDGTTLACNFLRVSTTHFVRKCRGSAGFLANETWLEHISTQWKHSAPIEMMFLSGSSLVISLSISAVDLSSVS